MIKWMIVASLLVTSSAWGQAFPTKPDPQMTSGDYCDTQDRDFVGYRYQEQIPYCVRNVSRYIKSQIYDMYSIPDHCRSEYTVDHFIPLSMGGSNANVNLWPEHRNVKATRQNMEQQLYDQLRRGMISQHAAVQAITEAKMNPPSVIDTTACH